MPQKQPAAASDSVARKDAWPVRLFGWCRIFAYTLTLQSGRGADLGIRRFGLRCEQRDYALLTQAVEGQAMPATNTGLLKDVF